VKVLEVDLDRERISLSLKATAEDPWKQLVQDFPIGAIIEGTVTKLVPFGAFVELGNGVEGLVHISEMAKGHVETPDQVTSVGQKVMVKVQDVDLERRRISLSMRAAAEALGIVIEIAGREGVEDEDESVEGIEVEAAETDAEVEETADVEEPAADEAAEEPAAEEPAAEEAVEVEEPAEEPAAEEAAEVEEPAGSLPRPRPSRATKFRT
jgi:small subunit ribosomal protein S1